MFGDFPHLASRCSKSFKPETNLIFTPNLLWHRYCEGRMSFRPHCIIKSFQWGFKWKSGAMGSPLAPPHRSHPVSEDPTVTRGFPGGSVVKNPLSSVGDSGCFFKPWSGRSPRVGSSNHSSILAYRIPWTEKPGRLQSMGTQRVGHNWTHTHTHTHMCWNRTQGCLIPRPVGQSSFFLLFYFLLFSSEIHVSISLPTELSGKPKWII